MGTTGTEGKDKRRVELDKYWKAVKENPQDFTGWTYLLQFVEQENKLDWCRESFDAFFGHFPYCYGYWKKYSDLEKRNGNVDKAQQVFERGLKAIPLSVDLWLHFINFYKQEFEKSPGSEEKIRSIYERSLMASGTEFKSDRLWEQYINWETSKKNFKSITKIYDRLLRIPTQLYKHHFEKFKEFVSSHEPREILEIDEFLKVRQEVVSSLQSGRRDVDDDVMVPGIDQPPGTERNPIADATETQAIKDRIIEVRNVVHRLTEEEVSKRWNFEEGIRRPYFHVKPLERSQLRNWREYLDFEMEHGSHERTMVLFERCMIACAHYEDFWIKYAQYMEAFSADAVRNIYKRACAVHLRKKPYIHTAWASFEERQGNLAQAREILTRLDRNLPGLAMVAMRKISVERRAGNSDAVDRLFRKHIDQAEKSGLATFFTIKFARYLSMSLGNAAAARDALQEGLQRDPSNPRLYLQLLELELRAAPSISEENVLQVFDLALKSESLTPENKLMFSQRRMQFLEDFTSSVAKIQECYLEHQKLLKEVQSAKKKRVREESKQAGDEPDSKRAKSDAAQPMPVQDFFNSQNYYGYAGQYTGHGAAWTGYPTQYHTAS